MILFILQALGFILIGFLMGCFWIVRQGKLFDRALYGDLYFSALNEIKRLLNHIKKLENGWYEE